MRMTTLRGARRDNSTVSLSAACVLLPTRDARLSAGDANLHCTETTKRLGKTTRHFTVDTMIATETPQH